MTDIYTLITLLIGFASLLTGGCVTVFKLIMPLVKDTAEIKTKVNDERETIKEIKNDMDCVKKKLDSHETRLVRLESKVFEE